MATVYQMKCPECGCRFEEIKGILMSECGKPIPPERESDAPFKCPKCGKVFCLRDKDFNDNVEIILMAD